MGPFIDVLPKELQESFPLWYDFHPKLKEKTAVNPPIGRNTLWYFLELKSLRFGNGIYNSVLMVWNFSSFKDVSFIKDKFDVLKFFKKYQNKYRRLFE